MFKKLLEKSNYEKFVGMSFTDIKDKKEEYIERYNIIFEEIFGEEIIQKDSEEYNQLLWVPVVNIEAELVSRINKALEEKGKKFKLYTLEVSATEQLTHGVINHIIEELTKFAKSLCSSEKEEEMLDKYMCENISNEELLKDLETSYSESLINVIDIIYDEVEKELEVIKKDIKSAFELIKDVEENTKEGQQEAERFSANFVPPVQQPVDVDYTEVSNENDNEEQELLIKIQECVSYYHNKDRVLAMIGGRVDLVDTVMNKILEESSKMYRLVETSYGTISVDEIKTKLSSMQLELTNMIQSYNPNNKNDMSTIINSLKAIQVNENGEPIIFEDFFGRTINADDIKNGKVQWINDSENSKILEKHEEIIPVITELSKMGVEVKLSEVKSTFKHIPSVVRAELFINGQSINKPLVFDTNGVLFNDEKKILLVNENGVEEDGIVLSLDNITTLKGYIYGSISNEELKKHDIIDEELRIMNRIVDLSSMIPSIRKCVLNILNQKPSKQLLNLSVKFDQEVRFKISKWKSEEDFELMSDSTVMSSFFGSVCNRKKQIIKFKKGELTRFQYK